VIGLIGLAKRCTQGQNSTGRAAYGAEEMKIKMEMELELELE
jgi:hypothetical protein